MNLAKASAVVLSVLCLSVMPAAASTIHVSMSADSGTIDVGALTTVYVDVEVTDGEPGNGIYAYALNVLFDQPDIVGIGGVVQPGGPADWASDAGTIEPGGLYNVYGGDGDYFTNSNRGVGAPFRILEIEIQGLGPGEAMLSAEAADQAIAVGVPDGVLLQVPGDVQVDYGPGLQITVVPEPAGLTFLLAAMLLIRSGRSATRY